MLEGGKKEAAWKQSTANYKLPATKSEKAEKTSECEVRGEAGTCRNESGERGGGRGMASYSRRSGGSAAAERERLLCSVLLNLVNLNCQSNNTQKIVSNSKKRIIRYLSHLPAVRRRGLKWGSV